MVALVIIIMVLMWRRKSKSRRKTKSPLDSGAKSYEDMIMAYSERHGGRQSSSGFTAGATSGHSSDSNGISMINIEFEDDNRRHLCVPCNTIKSVVNRNHELDCTENSTIDDLIHNQTAAIETEATPGGGKVQLRRKSKRRSKSGSAAVAAREPSGASSSLSLGCGRAMCADQVYTQIRRDSTSGSAVTSRQRHRRHRSTVAVGSSAAGFARHRSRLRRAKSRSLNDLSSADDVSSASFRLRDGEAASQRATRDKLYISKAGGGRADSHRAAKTVTQPELEHRKQATSSGKGAEKGKREMSSIAMSLSLESLDSDEYALSRAARRAQRPLPRSATYERLGDIREQDSGKSEYALTSTHQSADELATADLQTCLSKKDANEDENILTEKMTN